MPTNITLKDRLNADVVFVPASQQGNTVTYISAGASMLATKRLQLTLRENGNTNRVVGKLSVPSVGTSADTGVPVVKWTEVGSFDLSSVRAAELTAAEDFIAMFSSLVASTVVDGMYTTGVHQ